MTELTDEKINKYDRHNCLWCKFLKYANQSNPYWECSKGVMPIDKPMEQVCDKWRGTI